MASSKSKLSAWVLHRLEVIGLDDPLALAARAGLEPITVVELLEFNTLAVLPNWSARRRLCAALRISPKQLAEVEDRGAWPPDGYCYDANPTFRPPTGSSGHDRPRPIRPEDRGTPGIGLIRYDGSLDVDEHWSLAWGKRLPVRYGNGRNVYAMELLWDGRWAVFRVAPVYELSPGSLATVFVSDGCGGGTGYYCRLLGTRDATRASLVFPDGDSLEVPCDRLVCAGRPIGRYPLDPDHPDGGVPITPPERFPGEFEVVVDEYAQEMPDYESCYC